MAEVIQRGQYRPAAAPVQYQRGMPAPAPEWTPQDNSLMALGRALSTFNQSLIPMIDQYMGEKRIEANQRFAAELSQVSDDDLDNYLQQRRPGLSRMEQNALDAQYGVRVATARKRQIQRDLATGAFDPTTQDFEEYLAGIIRGDTEAYDSPQFLEAYNSVMLQASNQFRDLVDQRHSEAYVEEVEQGFHELALQTIDEGLTAGLTPSEIRENLWALAASHGPGSPFNFNPKRLDELMMQVATQAAREGNLELVEELLDGPRKDFKTGKSLPSLSRIKSRADQVDRIKQFAKQRHQQLLNEEFFMEDLNLRRSAALGELPPMTPDVVEWLQSRGWTPQQIAALENTNRSVQEAKQRQLLKEQDEAEQVQIKDVYILQAAGEIAGERADLVQGLDTETSQGTRVTMSREEAIQEALSKVIFPQIERQFALPEDAPEEQRLVNDQRILREKANVMARAGVVDKAWTAAIKQGPLSASQIGGSSEALHAGLVYYSTLKNQNQHLARQTAGEDGARFYDNILLLEQFFYNGDREAAVRHAMNVRENRDLIDANLSGFTKDEFDSAFRTVRNKDRFLWFFGEVADEFEPMTRRMIRDRANMFVGMGLHYEDAVDLASRALMESHMVVRGRLVSKHDYNMSHPQNFEAMENFAVEQIVANHPDGDMFNPDKIYLMPSTDQESVWEFFDAGTGRAITGVEIEVPLRKLEDGSVETLRFRSDAVTLDHLRKLEEARTYQFRQDLGARQEDHLRRYMQSYRAPEDAGREPGLADEIERFRQRNQQAARDRQEFLKERQFQQEVAATSVDNEALKERLMQIRENKPGWRMATQRWIEGLSDAQLVAYYNHLSEDTSEGTDELYNAVLAAMEERNLLD